MKKSEKAAREELKSRGVHVTKKGGDPDPARRAEEIRSFKEGPISRLLNPKTSKKK